MREMTAIEAAWVGAFIEAEGYWGIRAPSRKARELRPRPVCAVVNTDVEMLSTLLRLTEVGIVYHRPARTASPLSRKPLWAWQVASIDDVVQLAQAVTLYSPSAAGFLQKWREALRCESR